MATVNEIREAQRKSWDTFASGWKKHDAFMMQKLQPVGDALLEAVKLRDGYKLLTRMRFWIGFRLFKLC
ncbi:hypothetical protein HYV81_06105 [Candidatus Woesearchaeota archaeon]|nr:hypothetical protein [Candidatus Woesearchaeota archaeon]